MRYTLGAKPKPKPKPWHAPIRHKGQQNKPDAPVEGEEKPKLKPKPKAKAVRMAPEARAGSRKKKGKGGRAIKKSETMKVRRRTNLNR